MRLRVITGVATASANEYCPRSALVPRFEMIIKKGVLSQ